MCITAKLKKMGDLNTEYELEPTLDIENSS